MENQFWTSRWINTPELIDQLSLDSSDSDRNIKLRRKKGLQYCIKATYSFLEVFKKYVAMLEFFLAYHEKPVKTKSKPV